jgi:hypothetical protein
MRKIANSTTITGNILYKQSSDCNYLPQTCTSKVNATFIFYNFRGDCTSNSCDLYCKLVVISNYNSSFLKVCHSSFRAHFTDKSFTYLKLISFQTIAPLCQRRAAKNPNHRLIHIKIASTIS